MCELFLIITCLSLQWNTEDRKVISTELISGESIKSAFGSGATSFDKEIKDEGMVKETTEVN